MKKKSFTIAVLIMVVLAAFTNSGNKPASTTNTEDAKMVIVEKAKAPEFQPFDVVVRSNAVKDYTKWRSVFDTDSTARKASGMELIVVGRGLENNNDLVVVFKVSDVQKAKAFFANPRLRPLMEKAGVISKPNSEFFHVIRFNADSKEKQWVTITHKVKDFDAWLKVFDAEGTATRATYGLVDVALACGIDDPNLVHIVFDINDMTKAKNRMSDPALQKLMMDAGVEGEPKIEFYSLAE
jgi:hypothetical protein